jgi:8-oxo-dGTP pyrophosphatase MutT (NUDIX family)
MKIFALNLCLSFEVERATDIPSGQRIHWEEVPAILQHANVPANGEFVVPVPADPGEAIKWVFALQADETWRESATTWRWIFPGDTNRQDFLQDFTQKFRNVDAAGGLVLNEREEALLIYNRDRWSLPKGHVEPRETPAEAAKREVEEETGLQKVVVHQEMPATWHTFAKRADQWVLKKTYWYLMYATLDQPIIPQHDEHIEAVRWISREQWEQEPFPTYPLTRFFLESHWIHPDEPPI